MAQIELREILVAYGLGPLFILLAIPLAFDKVPPNGFYGVRLPSTLDDPEVWYAVNRKVGRELATAGATHLLIIGGASLYSLARGRPLTTLSDVSALLAGAIAVWLFLRSIQVSREFLDSRFKE